MKKQKIMISVLALLLAAGILITVLVITGRGLKTIDNEYLFTLEGEWDGARDFSEGLAAVKQDGKWGYIDTNGTVVIPPQYDGANSFSEGLAAVQKNGKWGYIDKTGNIVISFSFESTYAFSEGLAVYASGYYYGYIDTTGKAVVPAVYTEATSFRNGVACVKKDSAYGFINTEGTPVTEFVYGGKARADEGLIPVFYKDSSLGINSGYIDTTGASALDFLWYDAGTFSEGLAAACTEYTKPYGFIDKTGTFVIAPTWDSVEDFSQGRALVEKNRVFTYIDTTGKQITEKTYEKAYSFTKDSIARIAIPSGTDWKFGYIDTAGKEIIPPTYTIAMDFQQGCAAVSNGKKWGFIGKDGTELSGYLWTDVGSFSEEGIARVRSKNVYGFVKLK